MLQSTLIGEILALTSEIKATPPTSSPGLLLREKQSAPAQYSLVASYRIKVVKTIKSQNRLNRCTSPQ